MKRKRLMLLGVAAILLMAVATATAVAATHVPVPPDQHATPGWVTPGDTAAYQKGYREDYQADLQAQETGSVATPKASDPGEPMLLLVAPEDRDEAIARVVKGEDLPLVERPDGLQAIAR